MRLGGSLFQKYDHPEEWIQILKNYGYGAALSPVDAENSDANAYVKAAEKAGIIIAEVGAWSNPLCRDDKKRKEAIEFCKKQLDLAERLKANCCVNIAGSRGENWDSPDKDNLTRETFGLIVETVREIIDAVKPRNTFYTLEPMPWMYPNSPENYLKLIKAVGRKAFAVHLDVVNIVSSPQIYYNNTEFIKKCFKILGPYIKSCHAKDIILRNELTVHLDEVRPSAGGLDYPVYLKELNKLGKDMPLIIEHLDTEEEYLLSAEFIRKTASENSVDIINPL